MLGGWANDCTLRPVRRRRTLQVFCSFFVVNLFVGVVVENYSTAKDKATTRSQGLVTPQQKEWADMRMLMARMKPLRKVHIPETWLQRLCYNITTHSRFEAAVVVCVLVNTIAMALPVYGASDEYMYVPAPVMCTVCWRVRFVVRRIA